MPIDTRFSHQNIKFKEEGQEFYSEGFIATTHKDREGDILTENAIKKIVDSINNKKLPQASAVSDRHDWLREQDPTLPLAGKAISAEIRKTDDGNVGAYVRTHHHKFHPEFNQIKYNVEHEYYPGYSIEFETVKDHETAKGREIDDLELVGYGFANSRLICNPEAEIVDYGYKELVGLKPVSRSKIKKQGEVKMPETKEEEQGQEEKKEEVKKEEKQEVKEPEQKEVKIESKELEQRTVSKKDYELIQKMRAEQERSEKMKEVDEAVKAQIKEQLKSLNIEQTPMFNTDEEGKVQFKEFDSYKESLTKIKELDEPITLSQTSAVGSGMAIRESKHKKIINQQYKEAAKLYDSFVAKGVDPYRNFKQSGPAEGKEFSMEAHENRLEMKEMSRLNKYEMKAGEGLQTDTNLADASWTYGSYYLSPVELNDIFQPVLVNQLNDQTTTFGRLQKESWAGRSQIQFRARTGRNSTAGGYAEGANLTYASSFTGTVGRDKFQQPYCYYRVSVAITGQAQRFGMAPGGMGDVWANEIKHSMTDLMVTLNQDVLGTGDGTSESTCLGFEGLILGTSGTLYGKNIATYTTLKSHKENMSSARITLDQLRKMIRNVVGGDTTITNSNARVGDLVFFCHHLQRDFIKGLLQDMQRMTPTSARAGFEGEVEFDGVPVVADKDINTDDMFLIDTAHTKIAMNLPPTLEPLPVTADAQAAHIKLYWNLYSDAPSNNYWANTLATS